jgi:hypothetical protein
MMSNGNRGRMYLVGMLAAVAVIGWAVSSAQADSNWQITLNVAEVGQSSVNVAFGVNPAATDGLDESLGDSELPPLPPAGVLDVRFLNAGNGTALDLRSGISTQLGPYTLTLRARRAVPGAPILFTWNRNLLATMVQGGVTLRDALTGGTIVSVDMVAATSAYVTANVEDFQIVFTSADGIDFTAELLPPVLIPVAPPVAGVQENQTPALSWLAAVNAASYQVSLGVGPDCNSVAQDVAVAGLSYQAPRLPDGSYCWQARSVGVDGVTVSAYSAPSTFDTIPTFGEWGLAFLIASIVGVGGWHLYRRRVTAQA